MRFLVVPSLLVALITFAACEGGETETETVTVTVRETVTETTSGTTPGESVLRAYFLDRDKVAPVSRSVESGPTVARAALKALLLGPEDEDLATAISPETEVESVSISDGIASVKLSPTPSRLGQAQVVYTLTQFPTVRRVAINETAPVGRRAFERQTPSILVESPLPGEAVEPGFEVTGTANTFEATFNYELKDAGGRVLTKNFVTATSGSGTRGTFEFTVPYEVDAPQDGRLLVFELSAADGSRIHESEIPLRLE
jgi:germination protein M